MILTETAQAKLRKLIIGFLTEEEIISLANTVTKNQLSVSNLDEGITALISFSQSIEELLKRQKFKKKTIFQFLASEHVYIDPNAEKHVMINKVVEYLGGKTHVNNNTLCPKGETLGTSQSKLEKANNVSAPSTSQSSSDETFEFSRQFANWFYKLLNSSNPSFSNGDSSDQLTSIHFFPDCKMKLLCNTDEKRADEFEGGDLVCSRLLAFAQQELLVFNPNLEPAGLSCTKSAHGLNVVHVCGTIHRGVDALGLYEQRFGLVKDPLMENNWRIKYTQICIQAGYSCSAPKLGGKLTHMLTNS